MRAPSWTSVVVASNPSRGSTPTHYAFRHGKTIARRLPQKIWEPFDGSAPPELDRRRVVSIDEAISIAQAFKSWCVKECAPPEDSNRDDVFWELAVSHGPAPDHDMVEAWIRHKHRRHLFFQRAQDNVLIFREMVDVHELGRIVDESHLQPCPSDDGSLTSGQIHRLAAYAHASTRLAAAARAYYSRLMSVRATLRRLRLGLAGTHQVERELSAALRSDGGWIGGYVLPSDADWPPVYVNRNGVATWTTGLCAVVQRSRHEHLIVDKYGLCYGLEDGLMVSGTPSCWDQDGDVVWVGRPNALYAAASASRTVSVLTRKLKADEP